VIRDLEIIKV
jgi:NADH dehydrogenase (ubiquinone) 1 alpha/beta subcomplex 1, acyl-carrier protein